MSAPYPATFAAWRVDLIDLCDSARRAARGALIAARAAGDRRLALPAHQGEADWTYGIDAPTEDALTAWLEARARRGPLSLLTEDAGWRHLGPGPDGAPVALAGFDHGGPRIAVDPVDGTRCLMTDIRSAWTVVGFAGAGTGEPRQRDLLGGVVSELPTTHAARFRRLVAERSPGGTATCALEEGPLEGFPGAGELTSRPLVVDDEVRLSHVYLPFARFDVRQRVSVGRVEAEFFARLTAAEGLDPRDCFDDQYTSSAGQLVLLALGDYRLVIDLRAALDARLGQEFVTTKPYDISGALLCAQAAGCVVVDPDGGGPLDFPLDAHTRLGFAGFANEATAARLLPFLQQALDAVAPRGGQERGG